MTAPRSQAVKCVHWENIKDNGEVLAVLSARREPLGTALDSLTAKNVLLDGTKTSME